MRTWALWVFWIMVAEVTCKVICLGTGQRPRPSSATLAIDVIGAGVLIAWGVRVIFGG